MKELLNTTLAVNINPFLILLVIAWTFIWKGMALWRAAKLREKGWFVAILLINTFGILEIIYIYIISKRRLEN